MKTIGLLGGTSWPSTIEYYKILNKMAQNHFGGHHSAKLILFNIDYHEIKQHYNDGWDKIPSLLKKELQKLNDLKPDCILICNNTLHKAYDIIENEINLDMPLFHMLKITAQTAKDKTLNKLLLLGTKFTMEDDFFKAHLEKQDLEVIVPNLKERDEIQLFQSKLSKGIIEDSAKEYFINLLKKYNEVDAVVLGCTELPLVINQKDIKQYILNPLELQCKESFEYAINGKI
ncbi:MAG: amino acid racemase [Arcobacteraceae bacterium]|nr:amino acid racemase [Arcobacteraceae bacterium]